MQQLELQFEGYANEQTLTNAGPATVAKRVKRWLNSENREFSEMCQMQVRNVHVLYAYAASMAIIIVPGMVELLNK